MKTIILIVTSLIFLSAGCNKDKNIKTVVNGTAINLSENKPLGGSTVRLIEGYGFASNTGSNTIETTVTDANGKFSFDFIATPSRWYGVAITDLDLYLSSVSENIEKGKTNDVVLKPETFGYIKLILDNSLGGDSVLLESEKPEMNKNYALTYYPSSVTSGNYQKNNSGWWYFKMTRYENNNETITYDTLFVERYEEYELEIKF